MARALNSATEARKKIPTKDLLLHELNLAFRIRSVVPNRSEALGSFVLQVWEPFH